MVLIFVLFGYQKWFEYEAQTLILFIRNGPLTFWMYPVFGFHGASWFLGVSEWLTAALLVWGLWKPSPESRRPKQDGGSPLKGPRDGSAFSCAEYAACPLLP